MNSVAKLPKLRGERVLVRVDYNVPIKGDKVLDGRRIDASYKTIDAVLKKGGTPVLIAHLGDASATLHPVATYLSKKYKMVFVTHDLLDEKIEYILSLVPDKTLILLENIRRYEQEEKNDAKFAKAIAKLGKYYVNEAFPVSHRKHASVVGIPKYLQSFAGFQLETEIKNLDQVLKKPKHPFLFMLGGAKFATKIPLLKRFSEVADQMVISGAILNTFYKVAGFPVGKSVVEDGFEKDIKPLLKNPKLLLPTDVLVERKGNTENVSVDEVGEHDVIVDIGMESVRLIKEKIAKAKLIVWNGPTGWYEKGYVKATNELGKAIIASKAHTVIGGGDTAEVMEKTLKKTVSKNIFISTGGGAALEYLAKGTLPGIVALQGK